MQADILCTPQYTAILFDIENTSKVKVRSLFIGMPLVR